MSGDATRRAFLGHAVAAGGYLLTRGLAGSATAKEPKGRSNSTGSAPMVVVTQSLFSDVEPRAPDWSYITEVLGHAGLFFQQITPDRLDRLPRRSKSIVILAGNLRLTPAQRERLSSLVRQGGSVIGIGGTSGLDDVFGVKGTRPIAEGWIKVTKADHPITAGLRSSLHVFGGHVAETDAGVALAVLEAGRQSPKGSTIVENRFGEGRAVLLGPDLLFSIVHIQQGIPVLQDGRPPVDGTAPVDDGTLKAEDGCVLHWKRDRTVMQPDGEPTFLEPITDELRELILRGIFHVARQQGLALPLLWHWPRGLDAVGHISHDSDGNDPEKAVAMLKVMNRCQVKSTWCILYPGGYPRRFYDQLKQQDYEIALHYDAMSGGKRTSWSKDNLVFQHGWLLKEAGIKEIVTNKNHYTRWEGRLDFLRWCEALGIRVDQTRGPSKKGTIGFPLGGSQPYFPWQDECGASRPIRVLEVNMITQDLVHVCPGEYGRQFIDCVARRHGVAHFLFHPAHILRPRVADTLSDLVNYALAKKFQWWTCKQIYLWETARRNVAATFDSPNTVSLRPAEPVRNAELLVLRPQGSPPEIRVDGKAVRGEVKKRYGFEFTAVATDLTRNVTLRIG